MSEIIFVPSFALFFCSVVLFLYYLGGLNIHKKYPIQFERFLNTSLPFTIYPTYSLGSDLNIKDYGESIIFSKFQEEILYQTQVNFKSVCTLGNI